MPFKKHKPEEIIGKLREVEIVLAQGSSTAEACRRIAVSEQTYYRWRKEYGGLKSDQARRMRDLEQENLRLRRGISDLTLDKLILQEAARGGQGADRGVAAALQHRPPAQQPWLPTTGPGNVDTGYNALTIKLDHSVGADQGPEGASPPVRHRRYRLVRGHLRDRSRRGVQTIVIDSNREARPRGFEIVLVLSGGNVLGAFEAGVYQAMHENDLLRDWIVGASIGAINRALIAGSAPERRIDMLRKFWRPSAAELLSQATPWWASQLETMRRTVAVGWTTMAGRSGIFGPILSAALPVPDDELSNFDTGVQADLSASHSGRGSSHCNLACNRDGTEWGSDRYRFESDTSFRSRRRNSCLRTVFAALKDLPWRSRPSCGRPLATSSWC